VHELFGSIVAEVQLSFSTLLLYETLSPIASANFD
jgi:hypothetical protein